MRYIGRISIIVLVLASFLFIVGCTGMRESAIKLSATDLKNVETARVVARDLLKTWPFNSGIIRGGLGDRINELPRQAIFAMEELDKLAKMTNHSDFDLGYSLGLRVRMLSEVVFQALKLYAPDVLDVLKFLL